MRRRTLAEMGRYQAEKERKRSGLDVRRGTVTGYRAVGSTGASYSVQVPGGEATGVSCPSGSHGVNGSVMVMKVPGSGVNAIIGAAPTGLQTNAASQAFSLDVTNERLL